MRVQNAVFHHQNQRGKGNSGHHFESHLEFSHRCTMTPFISNSWFDLCSISSQLIERQLCTWRFPRSGFSSRVLVSCESDVRLTSTVRHPPLPPPPTFHFRISLTVWLVVSLFDNYIHYGQDCSTSCHYNLHW